MKDLLFPRFSDDHLGSKVLLGIVLMFIPIVNFFAFGYLYRFLKTPKRRSDGTMQLPQWNNWGHLFIDGMRLLLFLIVYVVISTLLAVAISLLLFLGSFGYLRAHWLYFFQLMLTILMPMLLIRLRQYQQRERFRDLLKLRLALQNFARFWGIMLWPALVFLGLGSICGLFYGISWFVGLGMFFACAINIEKAYGSEMISAGGNSLPRNNSNSSRRAKNTPMEKSSRFLAN